MNVAIPRMMDLSAVQTSSNKNDIIQMAALASRYDCKAAICLSCFLPFLHEERERLGAHFLIGGTVGYPSGQMTTSMKVAETRELIRLGVDEIDMMVNDGFLLSGMYQEVVTDINAVKEVAEDLPLKVIVEASILTHDELRRVAELVAQSNAQWIKTTTGWLKPGTTLEQLKIIQETVGDSVQIKAAGGIDSLATMRTMLPYGVRRFGVGHRASSILSDYANEANGDDTAIRTS